MYKQTKVHVVLALLILTNQSGKLEFGKHANFKATVKKSHLARVPGIGFLFQVFDCLLNIVYRRVCCD